MDKTPPHSTPDGARPSIEKPIAQILSLRLATLMTIVTIFTCIVSYFYYMSSTEDLTRELLLKYSSERGLRESDLFIESDEYQARFQKEYIERYKRMGDKDPIEWFAAHMEKRQEDGTYRSKPELYHGKDRELGRRDVSASMFIGAMTKVTPEVRRALAIGYDMINQYGPAWRKPFVDLYFASPQKTSVSRWPGTPWGLMMDDEVDWREEEWMAITMEATNPQREQRWSGVLFDERNGNWMVSGVTPLDIDGNQVGMVGTDLLLDELVERTINETLSGTYNILLQADGRVIAHPDKIDEIISSKGMLSARTTGDEHLRRIYELAQTVTTFPFIIDNDDEFLSFTRIRGPDWYFITVYPKSLLMDKAFRNVGFIFLSGMASLLAMFVVIWLILKRNLVYPLGLFTQAVSNFEIAPGQGPNRAGEFVENTSALRTRPDEIGLLASSFAAMGDHLRATYSALEAKNKELEQIVYVASHDLRSPLVNIDGYARELGHATEDLHEILADVQEPETLSKITPLIEEEIPEALRFIRTSATKMDTLLTGLLRLSRSSRTTLSFHPLDMNVLITEVVESFEFQVKEAGVELNVTDLPPCRGDAVQVNQVFSNLLDNALKYLAPSRPGIIRISGRVEGGRSLYCVEDNGIGVAPAHLDKVFEIFHRMDQEHGEGEGLGLTIVKRIVSRLEGTIRVESDLGVGSRFYVDLPTNSTQGETR